MMRHAHLYFILGILISLTATFTFWLGAWMTGQLWSTQWGWVVPTIDAFIFGLAIREWRRKWRHQWAMSRRMSHELRCRWNFERRAAEPACARRMRDTEWFIGG